MLFFIVLVINLALFYLYKSSKLFTKEVYRRKAIRSNIFIFGIYLLLWIVLEPPKLPERIIVLPFQNNQQVDFRLAEAVQRQIHRNLKKDYRIHRWEWFYSTTNKDSLHLIEYRELLARKIGGAYIISGEIDEQESQRRINLRILDDKSKREISFIASSFGEASLEILSWIAKNLSIIDKKSRQRDVMSDTYLTEYCEAKGALLEGKVDHVLQMYESPDSLQVELVASAYLQKGIQEVKNQSGLPLDGIEMPRSFRRLYNLIIPYSKEGKDSAQLNLILADMYMHHGNYGMAEICLERAITQERYNPRIYHSIGFLHESRYEELGFSNRAEVLELAVLLDPGYKSAVYELANELYTTGTAAPTNPNTINSIKVLRNFLKLNSTNEDILSLLGRFLLQTKYTLEAMEIYKKLLSLNPNSAENHYNMGICYFHKKEYDNAKKEFYRSIEISDYPNAYLYLGAMNRLEGNTDKALYYYRERIKRKQGDDDQYAKEAMRGIRLILNEIAEDEETNESGNSK